MNCIFCSNQLEKTTSPEDYKCNHCPNNLLMLFDANNVEVYYCLIKYKKYTLQIIWSKKNNGNGMYHFSIYDYKIYRPSIPLLNMLIDADLNINPRNILEKLPLLLTFS